MAQNRPRNPLFGLYDALWRPAARLLARNRRLADGYAQRTLQTPLPDPADLWIQAASVGEAFLAWELLNHLRPPRPMRVLLTTNTAQGRQILEKAKAAFTGGSARVEASVRYFPFDRPSWMQRVVANVRPGLAVLLETELWPGQLFALKRFGCPVLIVNGRMSASSFRGYRIWPAFWNRLAPDRILAVSDKDARRFAAVFRSSHVEVMPNIKFDRLQFDAPGAAAPNPLADLFASDASVLVLGSVRQEEEPHVRHLLLELLARRPETVFCLFPRHQPRQRVWADFFNQRRLKWILRSKIESPVSAGSVVLWDTFGELAHAYRMARAAFVGGSLAPLGGQNFLEPLVSGVRPVIGPWWESFHWVGSDIAAAGLVRVAGSWKEAADRLARDLASPPDPEQTRAEAHRYVQRRQGGTAMACRRITAMLSGRNP